MFSSYACALQPPPHCLQLPKDGEQLPCCSCQHLGFAGWRPPEFWVLETATPGCPGFSRQCRGACLRRQGCEQRGVGVLSMMLVPRCWAGSEQHSRVMSKTGKEGKKKLVRLNLGQALQFISLDT